MLNSTCNLHLICQLNKCCAGTDGAPAGHRVLRRGVDLAVPVSVCIFVPIFVLTSLSCSPPSAYAVLRGPEGFVAYIDRLNCVLGRACSDAVLLSQRLGIADMSGLQYGESFVHVGSNPSVAR